ncbi:hypothetical protein F5Y12DRAFT_758924 [Xylaria sp. FL1777]|nr:hypothetical protein F5Y12DRAFT_758924 [Xylaria sp. FL1777]
MKPIAKTHFKASKVYITPIGSLLVAVAISVGHHVFYNRLDGQAPPEGSLKILSGVVPHISGQQLNISIGVFLATLVKTFLGIAVASAHDQFSWRAIKSHPTELGLIDSLFSSRTGIFDLLNLRLWQRYPATIILAIVYWLIPFSAVVTPAALSIVSALVVNSTMMAMPAAEYYNTNFTSLITTDKDDDTAGYVSYAGPLAPVIRAVSQSILRGDVVSMTAPFSNSTYSVAFQGPALRCNEIGSNSAVWRNQSVTIYNASTNYAFADTRFANIRYLAWPGAPTEAPWTINSNDYSFQASSSPNGSPLSLTVVTMLGDNESYTPPAANISLIHCVLWNATYSAKFTYDQGEQSVTSRIVSYEKAIDGLPGARSQSVVYFNETEWREELLVWSYMAVMEAFQDYVVGSIIEDNYDLDHSTIIDTKIGLTVLPFTGELGYIQSSIQGLNKNNFVQDGISGATNLSLTDALEGMFRNLTISLVSEPALKQTDRAKDTAVTAYTYQNVYEYTPSLLWVAYGIAIGTAALSVVAGCVVIVLARGGYSTKFSTILRVVHNVRLADAISLDDTSGKDPLPTRLEKTLVYFSPDGVSALLDTPKETAQDGDDE